jgi:hypothetical protein
MSLANGAEIEDVYCGRAATNELAANQPLMERYELP